MQEADKKIVDTVLEYQENTEAEKRTLSWNFGIHTKAFWLRFFP